MSDRTQEEVQGAWGRSSDGRSLLAWLWDEVEAARVERDVAMARVAALEAKRFASDIRRFVRMFCGAQWNDAAEREVGQVRDEIARLEGRVVDLRLELQAVEEERDAALVRVAALEAVLAEPNPAELGRLCDVYNHAVNHQTYNGWDGIRAILADLRARAGGADGK